MCTVSVIVNLVWTVLEEGRLCDMLIQLGLCRT